jgi:hypothetical protein
MCSVQIPPGIPAALEDVFRGFPQYPQGNNRVYYLFIVVITISIPVTGRGVS